MKDNAELIKVLEKCRDEKWEQIKLWTIGNWRRLWGTVKCKLCNRGIASGTKACTYNDSFPCILKDNEEVCCEEFQAYRDAYEANNFPAFQHAVIHMCERLQAEIDKLKEECAFLSTVDKTFPERAPDNSKLCTHPDDKCKNFTPKSKFWVGQVIINKLYPEDMYRIKKIEGEKHWLEGTSTYLKRSDSIPATPAETVEFEAAEAKAKCPFHEKQWVRCYSGAIKQIKCIDDSFHKLTLTDGTYALLRETKPATSAEVEKHFTWKDKVGNEWLLEERDGKVGINLYKNGKYVIFYTAEEASVIRILVDETGHGIMPSPEEFE